MTKKIWDKKYSCDKCIKCANVESFPTIHKKIKKGLNLL